MKRFFELFTKNKILRVRVLIIFLILIYIPIALNIYLIYNRTISSVEREKVEKAEEILKKLSQSIGFTLTDIQESAIEIARHNGIRKGVEDFKNLEPVFQKRIVKFINRKFGEMKENNQYIDQMICITQDGYIINYDESITIDKSKFFYSDLYKEIISRDMNMLWKYSSSNSIFLNTEDQETLLLINKIKSVDEQKNVGYIFTIINTDNLKSLYNKATFGITRKMVIYNETIQPILTESNHVISKDFVSMLINNKMFYNMKQFMIDGKKYYVAIAPIGMLNWYIGIEVPKEELTASLKANLNRSFGFIILISLFLAFWIVIEILVLSKVITEKEIAHYRLISSEKMNEKLRMYKHDFMNHLQIIRGLIELNYSEKALEYLINLSKEGMVIKDKYEIGIPELESTIFTAISHARKKNIEVEIECIKLPQKLPIKIYELTKILTNLIKNAIYALEKAESLEKKLTIKIYNELDDYVFEIINNVPVIPEEVRNKIFEKGFTTKGKDGSGFGLYIVKKLVEKNNGIIELIVDKEGNHFKIRFPEYL